MNVITVVTNKKDDGLINFLLPSAHHFNLDLKILEIPQHNYRNHKLKDSVLYDYLEDRDEGEVIFFTDGYDAMFLAGEAEIISKFHKSGKEILFSAEINCWPDISLSEKFPSTKSPFKYLCSGGFVGKAGFIKKKISENLQTNSMKQFPFSNQIYWAEQFLRDQENIALDTQCKIFLPLSSKEDIALLKTKGDDHNFNDYLEHKVNWFNKTVSFKKSRIYINPTRTFPCHLHMNGFSKVLAKEIADILGFHV